MRRLTAATVALVDGTCWSNGSWAECCTGRQQCWGDEKWEQLGGDQPCLLQDVNFFGMNFIIFFQKLIKVDCWILKLIVFPTSTTNKGTFVSSFWERWNVQPQASSLLSRGRYCTTLIGSQAWSNCVRR